MLLKMKKKIRIPLLNVPKMEKKLFYKKIIKSMEQNYPPNFMGAPPKLKTAENITLFGILPLSLQEENGTKNIKNVFNVIWDSF